MTDQVSLRGVDLVVFAIYMAATITLGFSMARKEKNRPKLFPWQQTHPLTPRRRFHVRAGVMVVVTKLFLSQMMHFPPELV